MVAGLLIGAFWVAVGYCIWLVRKQGRELAEVLPGLREGMRWWEKYVDGKQEGYYPAALICPVVDVLPVSEDNNNGIIVQTFGGGGLAAGFEIGGMLTKFSDSGTLMRRSIDLVNMLNGQPDGLILQFRFERVRNDFAPELPQNADKHAKWILENRLAHFRRKGGFTDRCYIFCTSPGGAAPNHTAPGFKLGLTALLNGGMLAGMRAMFSTQSVARTKLQHDAAVAEFEEYLIQLQSDLQKLGECRRLSVRECAERVRFWMGCEPHGDIARTGTASTRTQLAESPIIDQGKFLEMNDRLLAVVQRSAGPDKTSPYRMREIVGELAQVDCEYSLCLTIRYPNQATKIDGLEDQLKDAWLAVAGAGAKRSFLAEQQYRELADLLNQAVRGAKVVRGTLALLLAVPKKEGAEQLLQKAVAKSISAFRGMSVQAIQETTDLIPQFQRNLPGALAAGGLDRDFDMTTLHAADLTFVERSYLGGSHKRPVLFFRNQENQVVIIDPRDAQADNGRWVFTGKTRSGKSTLAVMCASALRCFYPEVPTVIIDKGGSFEPLTRVLGGKYCVLDHGRVPNPFDCPEIRLGKKPSPKQLETISQFFTFLLITDTKTEEGKLKQVLLREAVAETMESKRVLREVPRTQDLYLELKNGSSDPETKLLKESLARLLKDYIHDPAGQNPPGQYAKLLDVPTHPDFLTDSGFEFWDLDSLLGLDLPKPIVEALSYLIASKVLQAGAGSADYQGIGKTSAKNVILDEIWKILRDNTILRDMLLDLVKTGGKQGIAVYVLTQDVQDFLEGKNVREQEPESATILRNSEGRMIGFQAGDLTTLKDVFSLTDAEIEAIEGIRGENGRYKTFLCKLGSDESKTNLLVVEASPVDYWLTTTRHVEREIRNVRVMRLVGQGMEINAAHRMAIWELAQEFPNGATGAATPKRAGYAEAA